MNKLHLNLIFITVASLAVILLVFSDYYFKLEKISYNFERKISYNTHKMWRFDLKYYSYYMAGFAQGNIYLGNTSATRYLLRMDTLLKDTQSLVLKIDPARLKTPGQYRIALDSLDFHLFNGAARDIYKGKVGVWQAKPDDIFTPYFLECIPINESSKVFRYVSSQTKNNSLRKESRHAGIVENDKILEKQVDGIFCTSGMLDYNRQLNLLTYVYTFRNEILLIDTNLNLIRKLKTIDPVDSAKFIVSKIKSNQTSVLTSPSVTVNARSATWNKYLFIQSKLMGKKEDESMFNRAAVIDVYDLEKGMYVYSFYLPNKKEELITQFKVIDGYFYTIAGHYIDRYKIKFPE